MGFPKPAPSSRSVWLLAVVVCPSCVLHVTHETLCQGQHLGATKKWQKLNVFNLVINSMLMLTSKGSYPKQYEKFTELFGFLWRRMATYWSILVQVMACCLMATIHYLNQSWLTTSEAMWYFTWGQFHWKCSKYRLLEYVTKLHFQKLPPYLSGTMS